MTKQLDLTAFQQKEKKDNPYQEIQTTPSRSLPQEKLESQKQRMLSASSINTYLQCPRKFYYQYIKKLPTAPSIHLIRGSIIHEVLESFFDFPIKNDIEAMIQEAQALFILKWEEKQEELNALGMDEKSLTFFFEESLMMISNWVTLTMKKIRLLSLQKGISFEEAFEAFKPLREQYYRSEQLGVHGYIDAIHHHEGISILDYKTSKSSDFKEEYKLQLGIYSLLYHEKHQKYPDYVGLFFLKDDAFFIQPNEELLVKALQTITYVKEKTKSNNIEDYPMKPGPLCKWSNGFSKGQCDFYEYCFGKKNVSD